MMSEKFKKLKMMLQQQKLTFTLEVKSLFFCVFYLKKKEKY